MSEERSLYESMGKSKGNRIRASDKSLVYHFCIGWLLLLLVAVFLLLNLRQLLVVENGRNVMLFVIARQGVVETTPQLERLCQD